MPPLSASTASQPDDLTKDPQGGLVAGTLIHTKDGLVAIERVQVGDWVLSRSLDERDLLEYKRVVRVASRPGVAVNLVTWRLVKQADGEGWGSLVAATDQLFRVAGKWKPVDTLKHTFNGMLHRIDEAKTQVMSSRRLYISGFPDTVWVASNNLNHPGSFFNLATSTYLRDEAKPEFTKGGWFGVDLGRPAGAPKPADKFRATVYNIGVEDHGTCLAGAEGILIAAMADDACRNPGQTQGPARPYENQIRVPPEKKLLPKATLKKLVTAHLESVLVPLGLRRVKDRAGLDGSHFKFEMETVYGLVYFSGYLIPQSCGHVLYINCSLFSEAVRQSLNAVFGEPKYYGDGYCHLPLLGIAAHDPGDKHKLKEYADVDSLELLQPALDQVGALAPRVVALAQTVAGIDQMLNGPEPLRPDWPLFQWKARRRSYFSLVIAALAMNPEFDAIAASYSEIITGRPEAFSSHPDTFTMDGLARLVAHLRLARAAAP